MMVFVFHRLRMISAVTWGVAALAATEVTANQS
jgi:hypothetical protein